MDIHSRAEDHQADILDAKEQGSLCQYLNGVFLIGRNPRTYAH